MRFLMLSLVFCPLVASAESYDACNFTMVRYISTAIHEGHDLDAQSRDQIKTFVSANDPGKSDAECKKLKNADEGSIVRYNAELEKNCVKRCNVVAPPKSPDLNMWPGEAIPILGDFVADGREIQQSINDFSKRGINGNGADACRSVCNRAKSWSDLVLNLYSAGVRHGEASCAASDKKRPAARSADH